VNVLVLYGTTEGQTGKIARLTADRLTAHGHAATPVEAAAAAPGLDPHAFGAAVIAASLHAGR
jgi:menaquinone-dependent protoporphyrinogen oxidase